jgi:hypothetical protein
MLRKLSAIFLLLVLILPMSSTQMAFRYRQYKIRKEMRRMIRQGLPDEKLIPLHIPFAWLQGENPEFEVIHSKEFRYQGRMYDIVRAETEAEGMLYFCVEDYEENAAYAQLNTAVQKRMSGDPVHQKGQERLLHFFKTLCAAESSDAFRVFYFKQAEFPKLSTPRLMPGYTAESLRPPEIISL